MLCTVNQSDFADWIQQKYLWLWMRFLLTLTPRWFPQWWELQSQGGWPWSSRAFTRRRCPPCWRSPWPRGGGCTRCPLCPGSVAGGGDTFVSFLFVKFFSIKNVHLSWILLYLCVQMFTYLYNYFIQFIQKYEIFVGNSLQQNVRSIFCRLVT